MCPQAIPGNASPCSRYTYAGATAVAPISQGVSGQIGSSTERKRRGSATKSPSCLGHRVPSAIAVALAGCTSRRGNNAAHYCRLALSSAGFSTPAIARSNDVTRIGCTKFRDTPALIRLAFQQSRQPNARSSQQTCTLAPTWLIYFIELNDIDKTSYIMQVDICHRDKNRLQSMSLYYFHRRRTLNPRARFSSIAHAFS